MRPKATAAQLKSMRAAFAPLKMSEVPLECPPIRIVGVPPTRKPNEPHMPSEPVPMIDRKAA
jgi:hypothetical protein